MPLRVSLTKNSVYFGTRMLKHVLQGTTGATIRQTRWSPRAQGKGGHKNDQRGVQNLAKVAKEGYKAYQN